MKGCGSLTVLQNTSHRVPEYATRVAMVDRIPVVKHPVHDLLLPRLLMGSDLTPLERNDDDAP